MFSDPSNHDIDHLICFEKLAIELSPQHMRVLIDAEEMKKQKASAKLGHSLLE